MRKALLRATLACTTVTAPLVMADQSLTDQVIQGAESVHQQAIEWRHDVQHQVNEHVTTTTEPIAHASARGQLNNFSAAAPEPATNIDFFDPYLS